MKAEDMSRHYLSVLNFMSRAKQNIPESPTVPDAKTRMLRASLILEEALETVQALGFDCKVHPTDGKHSVTLSEHGYGCNIVEVLDGCCDTKVVVTGTLIAFGITDLEAQLVVDANNLAKFGPGHSFREDGKLIKPPDHTKPDLEKILISQGWKGNTI